MLSRGEHAFHARPFFCGIAHAEHFHELRQLPFKQVREGAALSILSSALLMAGPPVLISWMRRTDRLT